MNFERDIYTVSRLNGEARRVLEGSFPLVWVEGELSNLARPASGHMYFSLKDTHAQVRCALFRMVRNRLRFQPENGVQVLIRARVGLYEGRGEFQLVVEHMEPAGEGALRQAIEQLKTRLSAEGLFAAERKLPLPSIPRRVGVITSPSGAAVRDVLSVLQRRFPGLPVIIYPTQVQGAEAPAGLARALQQAGARKECDVLLLVRGGGSLEDLMAFNDEAVARAIAACPIPLVSGVGHEVDFTIADLVADQRAPTPSAAAELVSPDRRQLLADLKKQRHHLFDSLFRRLKEQNQKVAVLGLRLSAAHPERRLAQRLQRVDELELRLRLAMQDLVARTEFRLLGLNARLRAEAPIHRIARQSQALDALSRRSQTAVSRLRERSEDRLSRLAATLGAVSPLGTLSRGYAIVTREADGRVLTRADAARPGDRFKARLHHGELLCRVESVSEEA